ncbi:hypothetical protein M440DRAFT_178561 [Trichoderma longibrachiatum ATCC 18648]|uniref:Uncharacterized protein n=1 Tax=Trichoderma longibrachiatum ATCC 18648 TaxID=983965 RepID=A0A2T4CEU6_TRILO|nr:hypothetical protein M440DRAFT_178561 [Trichoderma longibrachiatum ATCC 18648]
MFHDHWSRYDMIIYLTLTIGSLNAGLVSSGQLILPSGPQVKADKHTTWQKANIRKTTLVQPCP